MQYNNVFFASPIKLIDFALASRLVYNNFSLRMKSPVNIFIYLDIRILKLNFEYFKYLFALFKRPECIWIFLVDGHLMAG